ncbi:MAG: DUF1638 domain-containing protein [Chloroflexi bacterium]|nr:DUF1638 domain-containing protein [Chloroflexota bacterium]
MLNGKIKILACAVVIEELRSKLPAEIECETLDFGLHRIPEKLKASLQEAIDKSSDFDTIVLAYGLCGQAVLGLQSRSATLVVPRADDCIAIFLGSREAYLKEQHENPGSLFLSKGWIEGRIDDSAEPPKMPHYKLMVERYGEERAQRMQAVYAGKYRLKHYKRMAFINTSSETNLDEYRETARRRADRLNLRYEEIHGSTAFMEKIAKGLWDDEFVVVPAGRPISFKDFWPDADKATMPQSETEPQ